MSEQMVVLPDPDGAHYGACRPLGDAEAHIVKDLPLVVGEAHRVKRDVEAAKLHLLAFGVDEPSVFQRRQLPHGRIDDSQHMGSVVNRLDRGKHREREKRYHEERHRVDLSGHVLEDGHGDKGYGGQPSTPEDEGSCTERILSLSPRSPSCCESKHRGTSPSKRPRIQTTL